MGAFDWRNTSSANFVVGIQYNSTFQNNTGGEPLAIMRIARQINLVSAPCFPPQSPTYASSQVCSDGSSQESVMRLYSAVYPTECMDFTFLKAAVVHLTVHVKHGSRRQNIGRVGSPDSLAGSLKEGVEVQLRKLSKVGSMSSVLAVILIHSKEAESWMTSLDMCVVGLDWIREKRGVIT
jgi:hypothetical protein